MKKFAKIILITFVATILGISQVAAAEIAMPQANENIDSTFARGTTEMVNNVKDGTVSAANTVQNAITNGEIIGSKTKSQLVEQKEAQLKTIEDYKAIYGNSTYGIIAYILNIVRIYSIPLGFLGIAVSAIYQFVIGNRHLENQRKGFNSMIAIVTLFIICQVLPLLFAIIVKGWRG